MRIARYSKYRSPCNGTATVDPPMIVRRKVIGVAMRKELKVRYSGVIVQPPEIEGLLVRYLDMMIYPARENAADSDIMIPTIGSSLPEHLRDHRLRLHMFQRFQVLHLAP